MVILIMRLEKSGPLRQETHTYNLRKQDATDVAEIRSAVTMPQVLGFGVHSVFCAPLITYTLVLIVVIRTICSEFKKTD